MDDEIKKIINGYVNNDIEDIKVLRQKFGLTLNEIGEFLVEVTKNFGRYETNISQTILYIYNNKNQLIYIGGNSDRIIEFIYGETGKVVLKLDSKHGVEYMDEAFK